MLNKKTFIGIIAVALGVFTWLVLPFPGYFSSDEFNGLPLIYKGQFIFNSRPRPAPDASLFVEAHLWDMRPFGFYLGNTLIHLATVVLVYFFYLALVFPSEKTSARKMQALGAAVLFLFWSNNSEAIFWISARSGSFAALFYLATLYFYLKRSRSPWSIPASLLCFVLALLSYETSWLIPLAIIVLYFLQRQQKTAGGRRRELFVIASYFVIFGLYLAWRAAVIHTIVPRYGGGEFLDGNMLGVAGNVIKLATRTIIPPVRSTRVFVLAAILLIVIVFIASAMILRYNGKNSQYKSSCISLALLALISLIPTGSVGISIHDSEGERMIYLANAFQCMLLVLFISGLSTNWKRVGIALATLTMVHVILLRSRSNDYRAGSEMSKEFIEAINNRGERHYETLYTINQPDKVNGAILFRNGFKNAIRWMAPQFHVANTIVLNPEQLSQPYALRFRNASYDEMKDRLAPYKIPFQKDRHCIIWFSRETCYFID